MKTGLGKPAARACTAASAPHLDDTNEWAISQYVCGVNCLPSSYGRPSCDRRASVSHWATLPTTLNGACLQAVDGLALAGNRHSVHGSRRFTLLRSRRVV